MISRIRRRARHGAWTAVIAALCLAQPLAAAAQSQPTSDTFAAATERFQAGDFQAALELFEAARDAGTAGPAVHYNIGVCLYRLGHYDRAAAAFRQLAERFPAMREIADYNLGLAELAAGRTEDARSAFVRASQAADETVADLAARMLEGMETAAPSTPEAAPVWTRYVELQMGHDDNVALLEESSLPAGLSASSPFMELLGVATAAPFARVPLAFDFSGYAVRYPDASEFDQEALRIGLRFHAAAGEWDIEAGPHYDRSRLDGDGFEAQLGASVTFSRPLASGVTVEIRVQHDRFDDLDPQYDYVAGSRDRLRLAVERSITRGRWEARYELERNDRAAPSISADRDRLALDYEHYVNADWSLELGAAYRSSRYELRPRQEDLLEATIGALRLLPAGWMVRSELRWADNDATIAPLTYERVRLGIGIAKLF